MEIGYNNKIDNVVQIDIENKLPDIDNWTVKNTASLNNL